MIAYHIFFLFSDGIEPRTSYSSFLFSLNSMNTTTSLKFPLNPLLRFKAAYHMNLYGPIFGSGELRITPKGVKSTAPIGTVYQSSVGPFELFQADMKILSSDIEVLFKKGTIKMYTSLVGFLIV